MGRVTDLTIPGVAWEQAKVYLAAGNLEEADKLREHMLKSDARLMKERRTLIFTPRG